MHLRERVNIADRHVLFLRGGSSTCVGMRSLCDGTAGELNTLLFQSPPEEGDSWTAVQFPLSERTGVASVATHAHLPPA